MKRILVSIIIATFNSEKTLPLVFEGLSKQSLQRNKFEILLIDGGSKDNTKKIGKEFGARIINNPQTEPVNAKLIGFKNALGRYIVYLDHDEVIENPDSLRKKIKIFKSNPKIKAVIASGYKNPSGYNWINNYINEFGDPFSYFIYKLSKGSDYFMPTMIKRYKYASKTKDSVIFNFKGVKNLPLIELCAAGSMIDGDFIKQSFPDTLSKKELIPHFFYLIYKNSLIAISKDDALIHYSSDTFNKYLNKIKWRVKNNIYHKDTMGESGFTGRSNYQPEVQKYKKYLFIPYSFTLFFCLLDSLSLSFTRKKLLYLIHLPLCLYTSSLIVYHSLLKLFGTKQVLRSYDEKKIIK